MVIVKQVSSGVTVYFPRNTVNNGENYDLTLHSEVQNENYTFSGLTDLSTNANFYSFTLDLSSVPEGEYEFQVSVGADVESTGLLRVGEIKIPNTVYNQNEQIIEYNG